MENTLNENINNTLENDENSIAENLECNGAKNVEVSENKPQTAFQNDEDSLKKAQIKIQEIEKKAKNDISKIQELLQSGFLNPIQGESLIQKIIKKGYDELLQYDLEPMIDDASSLNNEKTFDKAKAIIEFEKENPEFFNKEGRLDVLNYIKSGCLEFDKDEIVEISKLVEMVEKSAIERYLKQSELETKMQKNNEEAKSRLNANAQNAKDTSSKQVVFTREQIGKMSGTEFIKNEKLIMEQLKKGLIR